MNGAKIAHIIIGLIVLDFTVLEVCFGVGIHKDATALQIKSELIYRSSGALEEKCRKRSECHTNISIRLIV